MSEENAVGKLRGGRMGKGRMQRTGIGISVSFQLFVWIVGYSAYLIFAYLIFSGFHFAHLSFLFLCIPHCQAFLLPSLYIIVAFDNLIVEVGLVII